MTSPNRIATSAAALVILAALLLTGLPSCGTGDSSTDEAGTAGWIADCTPVESEQSIARQWNELALDAIRRDFPAPTVHARNLFHLSTALWDAWTAFEDPGRGWIVDEQHSVAEADALDAARHQAMSFAAHRLLRHRYSFAVGALESVNSFNALLAGLCYDVDYLGTSGDSPAAIGNRIAGLTIAGTLSDGSNEDLGYAAPYSAVNEPLSIDDPGTTMDDPNRWQPLAFTVATAQNGLVIGGGPQTYVGPHWGAVAPFALAPAADGLPIDPGPPPLLGDGATDAEFKDSVVQVIRASALLDDTTGATVDISPGSRGANSLGTNDGTGHDSNPATGQAYGPNVVATADWARVVAEFWADGPDSETPPGHWNTLANEVSDHPDMLHRLQGQGETLDRLEWDVRLYLVLNGALHDAAIAAWGAKAVYDYSRPISMIRYMGGLGQSSDPDRPAFDPDGLPLVDGLIEVATEASTAAGERHEHLADRVGEIVIRSWQGQTARSLFEAGGVVWMPAVDWMPYQRSTFVTPAFPAYVSGHSTFSRAAAEVLTIFTGDPFFPGGMAEHTVPEGELEFEAGPSSDVTLQWATYYDASDEAGQSRIYGGIHVRADDFPGRLMGKQCGEAAWDLAQRIWNGTI